MFSEKLQIFCCNGMKIVIERSCARTVMSDKKSDGLFIPLTYLISKSKS